MQCPPVGLQLVLEILLCSENINSIVSPQLALLSSRSQAFICNTEKRHKLGQVLPAASGFLRTTFWLLFGLTDRGYVLSTCHGFMGPDSAPHAAEAAIGNQPWCEPHQQTKHWQGSAVLSVHLVLADGEGEAIQTIQIQVYAVAPLKTLPKSVRNSISIR